MRRVVQNEIDNLLSADPSERSEQLDRLHDAFIPWLAAVNSDTDQPMRRIAPLGRPARGQPLTVERFRRSAAAGQGSARRPDRGRGGVGESAVSVGRAGGVATGRSVGSARCRRGRAGRASAWERSGRHDDWLLDGARLAGAETLSARPGFGARLNAAGEFLLASRRRTNRKLEDDKLAAEAHARSLRRRSQLLAALLAVIVLVAACLAVISLQRADRPAEQRQAIAAKLTGQSRAMLGGARLGGDRRALQQMLAAEALERGSDPESLLNTLIDTQASGEGLYDSIRHHVLRHQPRGPPDRVGRG